jgi:FAD synthetase
MVFGTFDILHPGHIYFLKEAKKYGDFLIVSIARDANVERVKGHAARHTETDRKKLLESLRFVNKVVLGAPRDYIEHILKMRPRVIALGYDQKAYTHKLSEKLAARGMSVSVVRMKPYKPNIYKSKKLIIKK